MDVYERNVQVFHENRQLAVTAFKAETERLLGSTKVYKEPLRCKVPEVLGGSSVAFSMQDTVSAMFSLVQYGNVCGLNFADAHTPGGLVEQGATTQEEDICRCSNLYESLVKPECLQDYYSYNQRYNNNWFFTDRIILSKDVLFFRRSGDYAKLSKPITASVITCPAPVYDGSVEYNKVVEQRIHAMLRVLASNGYKNIILGAWGCGAFGGDSRLMGYLFRKVLSDYHCFDRILFAIRGDASHDVNFSKMKEGFYNGRY